VHGEVYPFQSWLAAETPSNCPNLVPMKWRYLVLLLGGCALAGFGIGLWKMKLSWPQLLSSASSRNKEPIPPQDITPCAIALAPHVGDTEIDREIKRLQDEARANAERTDPMKRLGWAFVAKARLSYDPGYYKLSQQCALCVRSKNDDDPDALLLQGHILQSLHKFKDAEPIARKLIVIRNEAFDYGLLGDVLMEQGRLQEAAGAYQKMIDLRPDLQSYTRVAHMRWLKGDLDGAIEVMRMALTAGSPRDPEPAAWAYTRLGTYELQAGDTEIAMQSTEIAFEFAQNYAGALLLRGRILLVQGKVQEAIESLRRAAALTRLPEYEWMLADALREAGKPEAAEGVESSLSRDGAMNDPRTFSLYLATRGQQVEQALKLAKDELNSRADVFTTDALAWALQANGRVAEALKYSQKALSEGTQDARLFYHAGRIALAAGNYLEAERLFTLSHQLKQMLTPLERADLETKFAALRGPGTSRPASVSN
jgi:tetratricopeptide (TPR) repeat protein